MVSVFETKPFAFLPVDWVHATESSLAPFALVSDLVFKLLDILDRSRPAAQESVGEWIMKSLYDPKSPIIVKEPFITNRPELLPHLSTERPVLGKCFKAVLDQF